MVIAENWFFNPILFSFGPLSIRWYGVMYLLSFWGALQMARYQIQQDHTMWQTYKRVWSPHEGEKLLYTTFWGLLVGGRIGYMCFYQPFRLWSDPLSLLRIWEGGMSFHGGLLGGLFAAWWFACTTQRQLLTVTDFIAPLVPIGLGLGRLGNFINGELWGRITTLPWGIVFPHAGPMKRHPSQLYEALLEGGVLFILLAIVRRKPRPQGVISALFCSGYGLLRFAVEYVREPDPQCNWLPSTVTMGQLLSIPMVLIGVWLLYRAYFILPKIKRHVCKPTSH